MKVQVWEEHHNEQKLIKEFDSQNKAEEYANALRILAEDNPLYYSGDIMAGEYWNGPTYLVRFLFNG